MRRPLALLLVVTSLAATGCANGLLFRNDHRITIDSPDDFASVSQPLTIRWTAKDFSAPADGHFVVFFDLAPQSPGDTIDSFSPLERQLIRVVDRPQVGAPTLRPDENAPLVTRNHHEVTVILVDPAGRRIGETAGFVEFDVTE